MSAIQTFLRDGGKAEDLLSLYAIKATRHHKYPNLVLFKYNQIESPFSEPIVQSARGCILDEADGWRHVSRPFDKFFNHGETYAASIDWSTAKVQEKLDGSFCCLYFYDGAWHVQSSGMPDAAGEVNGMKITFAELFWQVFGEMGWSLPKDTTKTYMFEMTTPYNRVVVQHRDRRLTLIGVRENETGSEHHLHVAPEYSPVRSFPLQTMTDVEATLADMKPLEQEGYVIVDAQFRRVKVKSPAYVAVHHMRDGFGPRRLVEVIRMGETTELLAHFPEWKPDFDAVQSKYDALIATIDADYARLKDIPDQKAFALEAVKTTCSAALFQLRKGKVQTVKQFLSEMHLDRVLDMLRVKADAPVMSE